MINQVHSLPDGADRVLSTEAVALVKQAMVLKQETPTSVNIDALFCLTNMLALRPLAVHPSLLGQETINNSIVLFFAYNHQVELDECMITLLYSVSKYREYHPFLYDKSKVIYLLAEK